MDNLGILIKAILSLKDTADSKKQIAKELPKLESQLQSDKNTRIKIVAGLDIAKSKNLIQTQLNTLANQAKAPTIKVGIDTSGVQSVKNLTNGLKEIQAQAQQTAKSVSQVVTSLKSQDISNDSISSFQKYFNIIGEDAKKTQQVFKDLFAELNNSWYSGDTEKYADTLNRIYSVASKTTTEIANSRFELKELTNQIRSNLTDGSKAFINPTIKSELKSILGESKEVKRVLDTVYGIGNWTYNKKGFGVGADALANEAKEIQGSADDIIAAYKNIQSAKSSSTISIFEQLGGEQESKKAIEEKIQSLLKLTNVYKDMNGVEHNYIQGLGWFESIGDEIQDIRTETVAIEEQIKATEGLKAIRESITRDADGQQIGRTSVFGSNGYTKTSRFNEDDELISYTETNNYQKLEQQIAKIEETRVKYSRLLADFKNSNSAIQSGLIKPIEQFELVLNGLGKTTSINDVKNAFESLKQSASEINAYLDTTNSSFNKSTNAVNHYKNMNNILKEMATSFDNLVIKPENLKNELDNVKIKLIELQNLEKREGGYTKSWAEKYREVNFELAQVKTHIELAVKAESNSQKADKTSSYQTQLKYLNKIKEETNTIISLKRKMVSAGEEENSVYQHEITKAQKRIQYDIQQLDKKKLLTDEAKRLVNTYKEQIDLQDKINSAKISDKNIQTQAQQLKNYVAQISNAVNQLNTLQNSSTFTKNSSNSQVTQTKQEISSLITAYQNLMNKLQGNITPVGLESVRTELTQLNARFNSAYTSAKKFETELKNDNGAEKLAQKVDLLTSRIKAYQTANSKANKTYGSQFTEMLNQLNNPNIDNEVYNRVAKHFQIIRQEINATGKAGKTFFQTLGDQAKKFASWMTLTGVIASVWREMRKMVTNVVELDKAMTNLKKVTDETEFTYSNFLKTASQQAKEFHSTVTDLIEQTSQWAKLGYNLEQANELAKASMIYSNVGEVDNEQSVTNIVSAVKAFDVAVSDIMSIPDVYNKLGNEFAVSSKNLGVGMAQAATTMAMAGNDFNQVAALLTGAGEILGDNKLDEIGNGLKTVTLRIQNQAGALKELGEEYEDLISVSKTQQQVYELTGGKVNIMSATNPNEFRDTYSILKDVALVIKDLNDTDASELIQLLFGKHRANVGTAVLKAFQSGQID